MTRFRGPQPYRSGPWESVYDTPDELADARPGALLRAVNLLRDVSRSSRWTTRPGYGVIGDTVQISGRWVGQFTNATGSDMAVALMGATLYRIQPAGVSFLASVDTNLPNPAVATTLLAHAVNFADVLVIQPNDGVHKPQKYTGAAIATLTNAPIAYGKPTVYKGSVFFINATDPLTIEWSDAGDPTSGYAGASPSQSWQLRQVSGERLYAILGTNDALYFWRQNAFDQILGDPDALVSSPTASGISATIGTKSPAAVVPVGSRIFFIDQNGRPQLYVLNSSEVTPIWRQCTSILAGLDTSLLEAASGAYWPSANVVVFLVPYRLLETISYIVLTFDADDGRYLGNWASGAYYTGLSATVGTLRVSSTPLDDLFGLDDAPGDDTTTVLPPFFTGAQCLGTCKYPSSTSSPRLAHANASGEACVWQEPGEAAEITSGIPFHVDAWSGLVGGGIRASLDPALLGVGDFSEKQWLRALWSVEGDRGADISTQTVGFRYRTPFSATSQFSDELSATGAFGQIERARFEVGICAQGSYLRVRLTHDSGAEEDEEEGRTMSFDSVTAFAKPLGLPSPAR